MVASKRTSSPGLLCSHRAPLPSGGSQRCSAICCHLPAGSSPAHGTSPLGLPGDKDQKGGMGFALSPFPGCHKRDLPPPNQLCEVDTTYELQTWVRTAVGNSQDILQCPRRWQKAELETTGEAQGTQQPAVRPSRVQRPQKCPAPSASAAGLQHGAGASRGFAGKNQARVTLTPCTCTRPRDPTTSPSGHRYHSIQKVVPPALAWS